MTNKLTYKGFSASVDFSAEDEVFTGKVLDVDSLILFSATDVNGLKKEFHVAVDGYLDHCKFLGVAPEKPCKGTFNVRIGADLHRQAATMAKGMNQSLNDFVRLAVYSSVQACLRATTSHEASVDLVFPLPSREEVSAWSYRSATGESHRGDLEDAPRVYN
jgi:predicted HicB family RNase H-like nuclease